MKSLEKTHFKFWNDMKRFKRWSVEYSGPHIVHRKKETVTHAWMAQDIIWCWQKSNSLIKSVTLHHFFHPVFSAIISSSLYQSFVQSWLNLLIPLPGVKYVSRCSLIFSLAFFIFFHLLILFFNYSHSISFESYHDKSLETT